MESVPFQSIVLPAERTKNLVDLIREGATQNIAVLQAQCQHDYRFPKDYVGDEARNRRFVAIRIHIALNSDFGDVAFHPAVCLHCSSTKMVFADTCPECFSATVKVPTEAKMKMFDIDQVIDQSFGGSRRLSSTSVLACVNCGFRIAAFHDYYHQWTTLAED